MTFSLGASTPLFPSLMPRLVDPLWFKVDVPQDEDIELSRLEKEHQAWIKSIGDRDSSVLPIGMRTSRKIAFDNSLVLADCSATLRVFTEKNI
jgi:hypothetical protein